MTKSAATIAAVNAVVALLVLLGAINLTADQQAGVSLAVSAVLGAVAAWFNPSVPFGKTDA